MAIKPSVRPSQEAFTVGTCSNDTYIVMQNADVNTNCILLQTDIAFNLGLEVLKELMKDDQIYECARQTADIINIESDDKNYKHRFRFGGKNATSPTKVAHYFARTASAVLRMCMLRSINASDKFYPTIGINSKPRNIAKMDYKYQGHTQFVLTDSKMATMEYYSHYDQLHPHFKLEQEFVSVLHSGSCRWSKQPTMMLIFRQNFSEIIEISTSLQAELMLHNEIYAVRSIAHVLCRVYRVTNLDHHCMKLLQALKYDPSEILAKYQLALDLPALDHIANPWTDLTDDEEEEEGEEEEDDEYDSELDDEFYSPQVQMDPNFGNQPILYGPPNVFNFYEPVQHVMPLLRQLSDQFAALRIGDQEYDQPQGQ